MPVLLIPLAAVDVVFTALFGIAIIVAAVLLGRWLGEGLRQVPLIGGAVAGAVESVAAAASSAVLGYVNASVSEGLNLIDIPARIIAPAFRYAADAAEHTFDSIVWVTTAFVPSQIASLHGYIDAIAADINNYVNHTVIPFYNGVIGAVQTDVRQLFGIAQSQQGQIDSTNSQVQAKADQSSLAYTNGVVGDVQTQVRGAYNDLASQQGQIQAIQESITTGAIAGEIAGVSAVAAEALNFVNECGEPMCQWWHGNSSLLSDLLQVVALAELGILIAEAVENPEATATVVKDGVTAIEELAAPFLSLVGL